MNNLLFFVKSLKSYQSITTLTQYNYLTHYTV